MTLAELNLGRCNQHLKAAINHCQRNHIVPKAFTLPFRRLLHSLASTCGTILQSVLKQFPPLIAPAKVRYQAMAEPVELKNLEVPRKIL